MDWDAEDAYMLAKIAMAEAESEDTEGKALVMLAEKLFIQLMKQLTYLQKIHLRTVSMWSRSRRLMIQQAATGQ